MSRFQPVEDLVTELSGVLSTPSFSRDWLHSSAQTLFRQLNTEDENARGTKVTMNNTIYTLLRGSKNIVTYVCDELPKYETESPYFVRNGWAWTTVRIGPASGVGWPMWNVIEGSSDRSKQAVEVDDHGEWTIKRD